MNHIGIYRHHQETPKQLEFQLYTDTADLDGHVDARGIKYIGKARKQNNGLWHCLAEIGGALCMIEVKLTPVS